MNPDTKTQFHVLRHADSTSTRSDTTHIALDFNAQPAASITYTYDDTDPALQYTGSWSHVANQSYTGRRLQAHRVVLQRRRRLASRSRSPAPPCAGSARKTNNHGNADVYVDGQKEATVDASGSAEPGGAVPEERADRRAAHAEDRRRRHAQRGVDRQLRLDRRDRRSDRRGGERRRTRSSRSSPAPRSRSTDATRTSSWPTTSSATSQLQYSTSELMTDATIGAARRRRALRRPGHRRRDRAALRVQADGAGHAAGTSRPRGTRRPATCG